jgi:hypothetical protein
MAKIDFGGTEEEVVTRDEFPLEKARELLKDEVVAVLGYGVQGPAQAMNMRDNGIKVIIGQRKGTKNWDKASKTAGCPVRRFSKWKKPRKKELSFNIYCLMRVSARSGQDRGMFERRRHALLLTWIFCHVQG